ncbi:MAG: putative rRNA maturation factor [Clostridiales bacterium]|nr:putative rRNA maturation factor [Clostridiales bacterium]
MTITYDCELECEPLIPYQEIMDQAVLAVLDFEDCPYEVEVNVVITNNEEIRKTNREFRGIDRETDVLSFPMVDYEVPGEFDWLEEFEEYFNPESGELMLGDIMLSMDKVWEQAKEYGHSVERELSFLTVHSMLHLCGYDHMEEGERVIMEQKQREIMEELGIGRA